MTAHCPRCGRPEVAAEGPHLQCRHRLELEPPRFCAACGRRMVVQVTPTGWSARCSRHGLVASPAEEGRGHVEP